MNKWGFAFIFLFAALLGYIVISGFTGIFPFERPDPLANEVHLKNSLALTLMLIADLVLLALGIYFGWIRSDSKTEKPTEKTQTNEEQQEVIFTDEEVEIIEKIEKEE